LVENTDRTRITVTLTRVYLEALDRLVDEGIYLEYQVAIRDALRRLFRHHGMEPFRSQLAEEVSEISS